MCLVMARSPSIGEDVRQRIIARVDELERDLTWFARRVGKSKQWASDFHAGRGSLTVDELPKASAALERPIDWILHGVTSPDTPSDDTVPSPMEAVLNEQERMVLALWRQLTDRAKQTALDFLWKLFRQQGGTLRP
jgi:hypothetical protein